MFFTILISIERMKKKTKLGDKTCPKCFCEIRHRAALRLWECVACGWIEAAVYCMGQIRERRP